MAHSESLLGNKQKPISTAQDEPADYDDPKVAFFAKYAAGKNVLDLGCVNHHPENYRAKSWLHKALRGVAASCVGLDLYQEGVAYLQARGFEVVVGDAEDFSLGKTFDVISAGDLIEHLENPGSFLECARRHLATNGVLLISTPNPWYWRNCAKSVFSTDVRPNLEHTCWFCVATLRQLLARHSFVLREVRFTSVYPMERFIPMPRSIGCTTINIAATLDR